MVQQRRCPCCTIEGPVTVQARARSQEGSQIGPTLLNLGRRCLADAAAGNIIHCHLAVVRPHGRLRCADRRHSTKGDWAARRCAPSFALIEPAALTRVRLETCAAAHKIIVEMSSGRDPDRRSVEYIASYDSDGDGALGIEPARSGQRSLCGWCSPRWCERAPWAA